MEYISREISYEMYIIMVSFLSCKISYNDMICEIYEKQI